MAALFLNILNIYKTVDLINLQGAWLSLNYQIQQNEESHCAGHVLERKYKFNLQN